MLKKIIFLSMIVLLAVFAANAQVPQLINYQGILTDPDGEPIDGTRSILFSIHDSETGGAELWSETQDVTITEGLFSVLLGSVTAIPYSVFDDDETYLELKVGSDPAMTPRKRLVSVAYAMHANYADHVSGLTGDFVESVDGVSPDGSGNIDLVEGDNITITPNAGSNQITISAAGGAGGDDLGNHRATQNIRLNDHWLSNDGGDEGIGVDNSGDVSIPKDVNCHGSIYVHDDITAVNTISAHTIEGNVWVMGEDFQAQGDVRAVNGYVITGWPSVTFGMGDIAATDEIVADNVVRTGTPSHPHGYDSGDIAATDDLLCDDDAYIGDKLIVEDHAGINAGGYSTAYALYVYGDSYCTGSWLGSDIKFKNNIKNIENPLSLLLSLNGVSYNWKTEEYKEREFSEGRHYGLIAQEVEKVLPDMVKEDENNEKAIAYTELIPILLEAIKQQQEDIEQLQNQVNQLMNR